MHSHDRRDLNFDTGMAASDVGSELPAALVLAPSPELPAVSGCS